MGTKYSSQISVGDEFGSWTVTGDPFTDDKGRAKVKVKCACGDTHTSEVYNLVKKRSTQCKKCSSGLRPTFGSLSVRSMRSAIAEGTAYDLSPENLSESFSRQANVCALTGAPLSIETSSPVKINDSLGLVPNNIIVVTSDIKEKMGGLDAASFIGMCQTVTNIVPTPKSHMTVKDFFDRRENQ